MSLARARPLARASGELGLRALLSFSLHRRGVETHVGACPVFGAHTNIIRLFQGMLLIARRYEFVKYFLPFKIILRRGTEVVYLWRESARTKKTPAYSEVLIEIDLVA
jgi:hypothetical protein